jgi:small multidrug resistance pump
VALAYGLLLVAILLEVGATAVLPRAEGFREPGWSAVVLAGYAAAIWLLSVVVRWIPVSTTYALWSGLGTAVVAVIGALWLGESWDWVKVVGLLLIVVGVVALNLHGAR